MQSKSSLGWLSQYTLSHKNNRSPYYHTRMFMTDYSNIYSSDIYIIYWFFNDSVTNYYEASIVFVIHQMISFQLFWFCTYQLLRSTTLQIRYSKTIQWKPSLGWQCRHSLSHKQNAQVYITIPGCSLLATQTHIPMGLRNLLVF